MDLASLIGLIGCIAAIIYGIVSGVDGVSALVNFVHMPSVYITIGGTFMSVLTGFSLRDYINGFKSFILVFKVPSVNEAETIKSIIELSNVARKEGLLSLEEAANNLEDEFLKKGVLLIVDGTDPELVRAILETELNCVESRHKNVNGFWETIASMGPAWGMIGTLIGLINMLVNLDNAASIGPNMSVALITTLYGSMLANWIALPVAQKLKYSNDVEIMIKEVMIEGLLSIQAGENPRVIEEKLKSFISPKQRFALQEEAGGE